jgi:hypothetical protein
MKAQRWEMQVYLGKLLISGVDELENSEESLR